MDKDLRKIVEAVRAAGYQVVINRKGNPEVYDADGNYVTGFAAHAKDWRAHRNALSPLKRRGFQWPPRR